MNTKEELLQIFDTQAGVQSLLDLLERMFLDHCYRNAELNYNNHYDIIVAYEEIKYIIEKSFVI